MISGMMRALAHPTAALAAAVMAFALMDTAAPAAEASSVVPGPGRTAAIQTVANADVDLESLSTLDRASVAQLFADAPGLAARLIADTPAEDAAAWWGAMDAAQHDTLVEAAPTLVGSLDGIDAYDRVRANRHGARQRLTRIDERLRELARHRTRSADPAAERDDLLLERAYLGKVVSGRVQLYLYSPGRGALVEMAGDPAAASSILFVVPGTNASLRSFMVDDPVTSFADWQVANADPSAPVLAFTVVAAPMPQISLNIATGPQNNTIATAAGADYARIVKGIDVAFPGIPTLSYEHSAGSQVGSAAEMDGARFDVRFLAAGVGATDGYRPVAGTAYYAAQAAEDVNRYYAGVQFGDIGYGVGPEEIPGVTIVDPGFTEKADTGTVGAMLAQGLDLHNRLFSGDGAANGTVLKDVRLLMTSLPRGSGG
jgi:hypothetical protein